MDFSSTKNYDVYTYSSPVQIASLPSCGHILLHIHQRSFFSLEKKNVVFPTTFTVRVCVRFLSLGGGGLQSGLRDSKGQLADSIWPGCISRLDVGPSLSHGNAPIHNSDCPKYLLNEKLFHFCWGEANSLFFFGPSSKFSKSSVALPAQFFFISCRKQCQRVFFARNFLWRKPRENKYCLLILTITP